ncbi:BgTH12-06859 [Blumeria graminis f. sp. triticale]|uniref:BgTH12-06859 n=1 Tax=Blumeria graminis f. sp. triticale TaxID=1689686 RepID=A0A9W4GHS7_BLUGR|nr:BgTH12-06859 [Blumeria graminis f. sp. triticale]
MSSIPVSVHVVINSLTVHSLLKKASINVSDAAKLATSTVQKLSPLKDS